MRAIRSTWVALAILAVTTATAHAGSDNRLGTGGATELRIPVGARGVALAGSYLGTVTGAEAMFYNPAGLAGTDSPTEVLFSNTQYIADMKVNYFAVAQQMGGLGMVGFSVKVLSVGEIPFTTESAPDGTGEVFSPTFSTLGLTYARRMTDRVNFGGTLTYISERVLQETAAGVAFDFGFQYDPDYNGMRLGMAMKNFGPNSEFGGSDFERLQHVSGDDPQASGRSLSLGSAKFELPSSFQFAVSYPIVHGPQGSFTIHGLYLNNSFAVDEGRIGAEYMYKKDFALRAGYKITNNSDDLMLFSYGVGLRAPLGGTSLWVDYAGQLVKNYFSDVQHVSVKFVF
ncbi:MAG: PorV/PorQ family protein [Candidatus Eisenbacteria bacterium]|uniref:PorV/PorQ family protein n=1 Tax=Eiseniibacteriota bacterium TaxID=2212470 RepID=A0A9D6QIQ6_UNCEI|nr:PorV/PorQ family protein [Candidatus Eisenbacteria bacterium]MBI3539677.1 PorV/PorQ family protein [Candidatus Eisenbacteria bacterium]